MDERSSTVTARIYVVSALLLFAYVLVRAVKVDFTHDESLSWQILQGDEVQQNTANNHLLNTALMYLFSKIAGTSEFILRLPNVLAFGLYLFFVYGIYKRFSAYLPALLLAFPILLLNPFLLDFFSLARGYGLAIAFFTGAVYYSMRFFVQENNYRLLVMAVIMNLLCIYANFSFLIAVFSLQFTTLIILAFKRDRIRTTITWYALETILLIPALLCIIKLKESNALYFGGNSGMINDTLRSVVIAGFYNSSGFVKPVMIISGVLIVLMFLIFRNTDRMFIKILLPVTFFVPVICFHFLDMLYPLNRAGLYWVVLTGIVVLLSVSSDRQTVRKKFFQFIYIGFAGALAILCTINFVRSVNISYATIWKDDAANEQALLEIEKSNPRKNKVSIGVTWVMEPSINYYIKTRNLYWIKPVTRDSVYNTFDYYYVNRKEVSRIGSDCLNELGYYPVPETHLFRNCGK